jgi:hypothetical protein
MLSDIATSERESEREREREIARERERASARARTQMTHGTARDPFDGGGAGKLMLSDIATFAQLVDSQVHKPWILEPPAHSSDFHLGRNPTHVHLSDSNLYQSLQIPTFRNQSI